jgi:hypothetical protein
MDMSPSRLSVSRETTEVVAIPPRPIRAIAAEALSDVDASIERLSQWGVKMSPDSRLHQARNILDQAVKTGELVPLHRGDDLGLRALELAFDYGAIAQTLPAKVVADMKRELRDSLVGPISPPDTQRNALQLQSQEVLRAALVRGGVTPRQLTGLKEGTPNPDFIIDNGMETYALETKRPQEQKNILVHFEKASNQVRDSGMRGGVLIDVTDALRHVGPSNLKDALHDVALELYDRVFVTGHGYRPDMSHMMLIGLLARVAWQSDDKPTGAMVQVHSVSTLGVFATTQNNLAHHRAKWIRTALRTGMEGLNQTLVERKP